MDNEKDNKRKITKEDVKKLFSEHKKLWIIVAAVLIVLTVTGVLLGVLLPKGKTVPALSVPDNFTVNGLGEAVWDEVENAVGYELIVGNKSYYLETNSMLLSEGLEIGDNFLKVKAKGDGENFTDSDFALYTYTALATPYYHFTFELSQDGKSYRIIATENLPERVIVPETYNDLPVESISRNAFFENAVIESVVLGKNLKTVDEGTFTLCKNLIAISVDPTNTYFSGIGGVLYNKNATTLFAYPMSKEDVAVYQIPASLNLIYYGAFAGAKLRGFTVSSGNTKYTAIDGVLYSVENGIPKMLVGYPKERINKRLTMPDSVNKIESYAFYLADMLEVKTYATVFGDYAFYSSSVTALTAENPITHIGISAFSKSNLLNINFVFSDAEIATGAFYQCLNLKSVKFSGSIKNMYSKLFYGCVSLASAEFDLTSDLSRIYTETFENCTALKSFTIKGAGVPELGNGTFIGTPVDLKIYCENSLLVDFRAKTAWKVYSDRIFPIGAEFSVLGDYSVYTLENGLIKEIGIINYSGEAKTLDLSFGGYTLTSIMGEAFSAADLTSLSVPDGIRYIGYNAFLNNSSLATITLNSVAPFYIVSGVFNNLSPELKIYVAGSHYAFRQASENNNGFYAYSGIIYPIGTIFSSNLNYDYYVYQYGGENCASIKKYKATSAGITVDNIYHNTVPYKIIGIDEGAFVTSTLLSVELASNVVQLERQAFYGASNLTSLTINSVEPVVANKNAIPNNSGIKIFVPEISVSLYKETEPFSGFTAKIFPIGTTFHSTDEYDYSLYAGETSIIKYKGADSVINIDKIDGYPVIAVGYEAFYGKRSLTSVTISDSVKIIGEKAFNGAANLASVVIGNGVLKIMDMAFSNITAELDITFGSGLIKIEGSPFFNTKLVKLTLNSTSVPEVNAELFSNLYDKPNTQIFVPNSSLYQYKTSEVFNSYVFNIFPLGAIFKENSDWKYYVLFNKATLLRYIGNADVSSLTVTSVDGYEVDTLAENLFGSNRITTLILGANVKTIRSTALANLTKLEILNIQYNAENKVVSLLNSNSINKNALTKIYVNPILVETYKNAENWIEFKEYIFAG